jgi:hypothetical protein
MVDRPQQVGCARDAPPGLAAIKAMPESGLVTARVAGLGGGVAGGLIR